VLFDVLVPIQTDVGRRWALGDYGIGDEHAISAAVETVVALLAGSFNQPADGAHVVVTSAEGESHSLPARVIAAYLTYRDFRVTNLGATMPTDELYEFLEFHEPSAVVLTCSMAANLPGARRTIAATHSAGVPVVAGGLAFGDSDRIALALGADAWLSNPRYLDGLLRRWQPDIEEAEARAVALPETAVGDQWAQIGAVAESVADGAGLEASARVPIRIDVDLFAQTLDAALLVDDAAPLVDLATWHAVHLATSGRPQTTGPILNALRERVGSIDARIGRFIAEAAAAVQ
jgi:methanogenic corrinoid protein MtbC1